jgi:uncharacterized protein with PIN domain
MKKLYIDISMRMSEDGGPWSSPYASEVVTLEVPLVLIKGLKLETVVEEMVKSLEVKYPAEVQAYKEKQAEKARLAALSEETN